MGVTGLIGKVMRWLPMPIVMAMIAGALIRFGVGAVTAIEALPVVVGLATIAFFLSMRFVKAVPPVLSALVVGLIAVALTGGFATGEAAISFVAPEFTAPVFTVDAFFAIAIPLAILVVGAENAQAIGVLYAEGYKPPVNAMTIISGVGGILAGFIGGHNANIAGPMTAICSSEQAGDDTSKRYAATVVNGVLFGSFGIFAGVAVPLIMALPGPLIGAVAGLAMIGVLLSAFQSAFDKRAGYQIPVCKRLLCHKDHVDPTDILARGAVEISSGFQKADFADLCRCRIPQQPITDMTECDIILMETIRTKGADQTAFSLDRSEKPIIISIEPQRANTAGLRAGRVTGIGPERTWFFAKVLLIEKRGQKVEAVLLPRSQRPKVSFLLQHTQAAKISEGTAMPGLASRESKDAKARIAANLLAKVWPMISGGQFHPLIDSEFALTDAAKAHELMEASTHIGKIVLKVA